MLSRRFLAAAFGAATLIGAAGLAVLPGAASARTSAGGQVTAHPVAAANVSPGGPMVPAPASGHASAQAAGQSFSVAEQSINWSGFVVTAAKKFTYAQSRFVQPAIDCSAGPKNTWSSNWVGFDGFQTNSPTVEQDGTAAHCGGATNTKPVYKAWYEMYPAGSVNVFTVFPGDTINTSVSFGNGKYTLTVSDLTAGHKNSATHTAKCKVCKRNSAEWIVERPALCTSRTHCFITHLADFGGPNLMSAKVRDGGPALGIPNFRNYHITMVASPSNTTTDLDTVGKVSSNAFPVTWDAAGPTVPLP